MGNKHVKFKRIRQMRKDNPTDLAFKSVLRL